MLRFGTSGLRGLVTEMTDLECYLNARGFIQFLLTNALLPFGAAIALAGDLRSSTDRILRALAQAIADTGCRVDYCGKIPSPALSYYAWQKGQASMMVTGSHIPDDRNGIKFNKPDGEVLKSDEPGILAEVVKERALPHPGFDEPGAFLPGRDTTLPAPQSAAEEAYVKRYLDVFSNQALRQKRIVVYQHSAVGRDLLARILTGLGADVLVHGRTDQFVALDTENVTAELRGCFQKIAQRYQPYAIVSTDGDSDRPLVMDEAGTFYRGDILGAVVARYLGAECAVVPISVNDAVDEYLQEQGIAIVKTRIGSPYVISGLQTAMAQSYQTVAGWEVNGGFLLGTDLVLHGRVLKALPTRDAVLPIVAALLAAREKDSLSQLFSELPQRYTQSGLWDEFPVESSRQMLMGLTPDLPQVVELKFDSQGGRIFFAEGAVQAFTSESNRTWQWPAKPESAWAIKQVLEKKYFTPALGFAPIQSINFLDGIRITFANHEVAHIRPSGNAPQLRIYSNADTQARADEMVALALAEKGILRKLAKDIGELRPQI